MITYLRKIFLYKEGRGSKIVNNKKGKNTNVKIKKKKKCRERGLPPPPLGKIP